MPNPQNQPPVVPNNDVVSPDLNVVPQDTTPKEPLPKKKGIRISTIILFVVLLAVIGVLAFYLNQNPIQKQVPFTGNKVAENIPESSPSSEVKPTERPIVPIVKGSVIYNVSQGSHNGPNITQMVIDPQEPASGVAQNVTVKVKSSKPVTAVEIVLKSDNTEKTHSLTLTGGTELDGIWTGSWTIEDTILYNYVETIKATNADGVSSVDVSIR